MTKKIQAAKSKARSRETGSKKPEKIDGLSPQDIKKIRAAIRKVWSWSYPRKLCTLRAFMDPDGFARCEKCQKKTPKVYIDHLVEVGEVDGGFIERLFCPSQGLQALCKQCHDQKTKEEREFNRAMGKAP